MAKAKVKTDKTPVELLTAKQATAEHARLQVEISSTTAAITSRTGPAISDAEYDTLRARYNAIEVRFPDLRTLESLSLKIGAAPTGRFKKVRHAVAMLSLDNAFAEQDVVDFVARIRRFLKLDRRREDRLQRRAEDRRAVDVAALPRRRTRHRRHPRRRQPKARTSPPISAR